ncbi:class I SAM-dependent methyltransferase [Streptomyces sp. NPDC058374]|uniref:class I SAM-dependent methyltransferase n=1 Tax=Streptomyces sp. NPDC058374 TaxID=3346466 RepID=UPI0036677571
MTAPGEVVEGPARGQAQAADAVADEGAGEWDLVWAAYSLHHLADPARTLAEIHAALRPGGLLAVVETESSPMPRFLPEDVGLGRPGLEERCHAAIGAAQAEDVPHLGADWGERLRATGFAVEAERRFAVELAPSLPAAARPYARAVLDRLRSAAAGRLAADDLAALDELIDGDGPLSLARRDDLTVRANRLVWVARKA